MTKWYEHEIRRAVGFARERGWRIMNNGCFTHGPLVRGKRTVLVCPIMALVLMNATETNRAAQLKKGYVSLDGLTRRAAKILKVKPLVIDQFMGGFDNTDEDKPWPRGTSGKTITLAGAFGDFGDALRKELRPRSA